MNDIYVCHDDYHAFIYLAIPGQMDIKDNNKCVCMKYTWKEYKSLKDRNEIEIPDERLEILK